MLQPDSPNLHSLIVLLASYLYMLQQSRGQSSGPPAQRATFLRAAARCPCNSGRANSKPQCATKQPLAVQRSLQYQDSKSAEPAQVHVWVHLCTHQGNKIKPTHRHSPGCRDGPGCRCARAGAARGPLPSARFARHLRAERRPGHDRTCAHAGRHFRKGVRLLMRSALLCASS